jgi:dGTPase
MDWADDVAYSVHDIEDAVASRSIDPRLLHSRADVAVAFPLAHEAYAPDLTQADIGAALDRLVATGSLPMSYDGSRHDLAALKDMTSSLVGRFVLAVEQATRAVHGPGPLTRYDARLVVPDAVRAETSVLKAVAAHFVMFADERVSVMVRQREVVAELAGAYWSDPGRLDPDLRADFDGAGSDEERLRVVVDQVASLTDARALSLAGARAHTVRS